MNSGKKQQISTIACDIKYWTTNERQCHVSDKKISAFCYHEKESKKQDGGQNTNSQLYKTKQNFVESRGGVWTLPNKRSDKLADCVRDLEEILKSSTVLHVRWQKRKIMQMVINTGLIVNILLTEQYDIQKIFFDKSVIAKIPPDVGIIASALLTDKFCMLCYDEKSKLGFVSFAPHARLSEAKQIATKISSMDMRISFHNIPGISAQRGSRKICINNMGDVAICWCSSHTTPTLANTAVITAQESANMVLLKCSFGKLDISSSVCTESNLISVEFSMINPYQVHSLERSVTSRNEVTLQYVTYECTQNRLHRLEVSLIPVKSGVLSYSRNSNENNLVIGCTDGTVLVYDVINKSVLTIRDTIVPSTVSWHPNGGAIMVASGSAELRCFDCALGQLTTTFLDDVYIAPSGNVLKLSKFLPGENGLSNFIWPSAEFITQPSEDKPSSIDDVALLLFDGGPPAILKFHLGVISERRLRPLEIVREHLKHENIKPAIQVLHTLNWNTEARNVFLTMISIVNHLLMQPLTFESEEQLEEALSAFYAPKHPIPEAIVIEYRHTISRYARRFFHHMLRFQRLEKAFLLAKDIQDADLFVDVYFCAKAFGEITVAKAARQKILELHSSSDEDSASEDETAITKKSVLARRLPLGKNAVRKFDSSIVKRKSKPFKVTSPRLRKEIVPASYPPPKMDNFMESLISETRAVLEMNEDSSHKNQNGVSPRSVVQSESTLTILDYGYV